MENRPLYKSAEELSIEKWEHDGLVALVGPLSRGELDFDMHTSNHECGTACCIGGWVDRMHGEKLWCQEGSSICKALWGASPLCSLYYAYSGNPKARHAARAIVNFLVTGDPQWSAVMSEG